MLKLDSSKFRKGEPDLDLPAYSIYLGICSKVRTVKQQKHVKKTLDISRYNRRLCLHSPSPSHNVVNLVVVHCKKNPTNV